jgi:predicted nucleic acid-binding protein
VPVVDASVLVEYLGGGEHGDLARDRLLDAGEPLWAPHLIDAEVGQVFRRGVTMGRLRPSVAHQALEDLVDMRLHRIGHVALLERAWSLRANLTFYDALYVALAELLDTTLLTFDARLVGAPGVRAAIDVIR